MILRICPLIFLLFIFGCAGYASYAVGFRDRLASKDYEGVRLSLNKASKGRDKLLYFLEKGLVDRYQGDYRGSNIHFELAERLADQLYTRSISREMAALLTNDAVRAYRGDKFELVFINYYRSLNYWQLGLHEDALVECRKANEKLARYAATAKYPTSYRNDAFIHWMTGLFYEATDELNDAYVAYRHAHMAYLTYRKAFGISPPPSLSQDLIRVGMKLGFADDVEGLIGPDSSTSPEPLGGELILLCETGFVSRKIQEEINLPIFEEDIDMKRGLGMIALSHRVARRYRRRYPPDLKLKYWLRVAVPVYQDTRPKTHRFRLKASGHNTGTVLVEDLSGIARQTLQDRFPVILARTVARGLTKYLASESIENKSKLLGFFANLFTASTEAADTRSWISLPGNIQMGRIRLPAGFHDINVEAIDSKGRIIETYGFPLVEIRDDRPTFLSYRTYQ